MSKPWEVGAWAADAERAEAEEKEQAAAAAVTSKQKKKTKMSLQEFTKQAGFPSGGASSRDSGFGHQGLTPDEMLRLPTGPKERSPDEMQPRLGGGFSSYGRLSGPPGRRDGDGGDTSWGSNRRSYGGFDDDRRAPPPRVSDYDQPSRADEVDNWAMGKKSLPSFDSGSRPNRYSSLGGGGISKADEVDNWAVGKKPFPSRSSTFGSGFRDSGPEPDRWTRGGFQDREQERPRLVLDRPRSEGPVVEAVKSNKPSPFGAARPREEVLAEKGLDWKKMDMEIEFKKTSRPTSAQSSRPGSSQSEGSSVQGGIEGAVKPRPKVNPFGEAKPREVLLQEKGLDWRKIDLDLEHRRVERPETEAEKNLKEEIDHLKMKLEKELVSDANGETLEGSSADQTSLRDLILSKERELEVLIRELDDKVRFGQKAIERPGSSRGRVTSFPERPSSHSGESRSMEFMERPRSRGTGDVWARQGVNDRRGFHGGRERGFLGNRDLGRSSSRERW